MAKMKEYDPPLTVRFPPLLRQALEDVAQKRYGGKLSRALRIAAARFIAYEYTMLGEGRPKTDPLYWLSSMGVDDK